MESIYHLFEDLPRDVWLDIKDFLDPADIENILNTGPSIWGSIFKDNSWLQFALNFDRCAPFLLGHQLSSFRPQRPLNNLYLAVIIHDFSGDIRYHKDRFFGALQPGWTYDEAKYEVHFSSGLTVNIFDVIVSPENLRLPLAKIFTNKKGGLYSEYCYYTDKCIKVLRPTDIFGRNRDNQYYEEPAYQGRAIKNGLSIRVLDRGQPRDFLINPVGRRVVPQLYTNNDPPKRKTFYYWASEDHEEPRHIENPRTEEIRRLFIRLRDITSDKLEIESDLSWGSDPDPDKLGELKKLEELEKEMQIELKQQQEHLSREQSEQSKILSQKYAEDQETWWDHALTNATRIK